jgi:hypothetical protein
MQKMKEINFSEEMVIFDHTMGQHFAKCRKMEEVNFSEEMVISDHTTGQHFAKCRKIYAR